MNSNEEYRRIATELDATIEKRIREELYNGCVSEAQDRVCEIHDHVLASKMRTLIREYARFTNF